MKSLAHTQLTQVNHTNTTQINSSVNSDRLVNSCCKKCGKQVSSPASLSRHNKYYCKGKSDNMVVVEDRNRIAQLEKQLVEYQQLLKTKEIEIENKFLKKENAELKSFIRSGKYGNTTYNISIKKYVQDNFSDAPALEGIKDYAKLTYDEDDFVTTIINNYNNGVLHKYFGDFIVLYYVRDNPSEQSIWNSDVSRLTYLIKELLANNESIWNQDPKGTKIKSYVINPLLKYIKNYLTKYWMDNIDCFKSMEIRSLVELQENFISIHKVKKDIDSGLIADNIVKYIAPKFYMNKILANNGTELFIDDN
jgi:hypothetical protein